MALPWILIQYGTDGVPPTGDPADNFGPPPWGLITYGPDGAAGPSNGTIAGPPPWVLLTYGTDGDYVPPVIPPVTPPATPVWDGTTVLSNHKAGGAGNSSGFNKRELDRVYDEWKLKKKKNKAAERAVTEAIEVLAEVSERGLLYAFEPAIELKETIEALPAKPLAAIIADIREQTRRLEAVLDEEEEEIMLMVRILYD